MKVGTLRGNLAFRQKYMIKVNNQYIRTRLLQIRALAVIGLEFYFIIDSNKRKANIIYVMIRSITAFAKKI